MTDVLKLCVWMAGSWASAHPNLFTLLVLCILFLMTGIVHRLLRRD